MGEWLAVADKVKGRKLAQVLLVHHLVKVDDVSKVGRCRVEFGVVPWERVAIAQFRDQPPVVAVEQMDEQEVLCRRRNLRWQHVAQVKK